jgi:hypothetical protein
MGVRANSGLAFRLLPPQLAPLQPQPHQRRLRREHLRPLKLRLFLVGLLLELFIGAIAGLALLIVLLRFFCRRKSHIGKGNVAAPLQLGKHGFEEPLPQPPESQEVGTGWVGQEMGTEMPIHELSATGANYPPALSPQKREQSLVDERVAAGYEGAYRGN